MECKQCRSGFPVLGKPGEKFCGFCGSSLKAVAFKIKGDDGPYYSDQKEKVSVRLMVKNTGVNEVNLAGIKIS